MIKLIDILLESDLKINQSQLKKLNKRLVAKGYNDYQFEFISNNKIGIFYKELISKPTEEQEYKYGLLRSFISTSKTFDDLYYSIL